MNQKPHPTRPVRYERSAGVLLFRENGAPPGHRLFLLLDYGHHWDYPKGHVEKGEDDRTAATRELAEETGITDIQLIPGFAEQITYSFRDSRRHLIRKTVIFFLAATATEQVILSHEHVGYAWLSPGQALQRLKYPTARRILDAALHLLDDGAAPAQAPEASPQPPLD